MLYADADDVALRLGRDLTAGELAQARGQIEEAGVLIDGHLGRAFAEDVPLAVVIVCSRMVARALAGGSRMVPEGATAVGSTFGPYGTTTRFGGDGVQSSPWLSRADKVMLAPHVVRGQVVNVRMF